MRWVLGVFPGVTTPLVGTQFNDPSFFRLRFFLHRDKDENGEELGGFEDLLGGHDPTSLEALSSPSFFNAHTF